MFRNSPDRRACKRTMDVLVVVLVVWVVMSEIIKLHVWSYGKKCL